jgi:hypothetical protein
MKLLILLALLLPLAAGAQVQKCTIEGKTVYSDSLCGQAGVSVKTDVNNLDTSGLREVAAKMDEEAKAAESSKPRQRDRDPCAGIKPMDRIGTSAQNEAYGRCRKQHR